MKRAKQFGLLTIILILPICLIWFLRTFGENKFVVPVFHQNAAEIEAENCRFEKGQHYIPDFVLVNEQNSLLTEEYLKGQITVVNFFYTSCPTICKIMSSELLRVQGSFFHNTSVKVLSISVDPDNDKPAILQRYGEISGAQPSHWNFATGDKSMIDDLMKCGFVLPVGFGRADISEVVISDTFVLVDSKKRIRGYYSGTSREEVDRLVTEMKILLKEENFEI